jgi:hypothetical protein
MDFGQPRAAAQKIVQKWKGVSEIFIWKFTPDISRLKSVGQPASLPGYGR